MSPYPTPPSTPVPPPPGTTVGPAHPGPHGLPAVNWHSPFNLTTHGCPGGIASYDIWSSGHIVRTGPLPETPPGSGTYSGTVAPLFPVHGVVFIVITITCPGGATISFGFNIYIDPSGRVLMPDGTPVVGATVILFRSDSANGPFTQVPNGSDIMSPNNQRNPDLTDADGRFGWDVLAGFYQVTAAKDGCTPNPASTSVMQIPPPVDDIVLILACSGPSPSPTACPLADPRHGSPCTSPTPSPTACPLDREQQSACPTATPSSTPAPTIKPEPLRFGPVYGNFFGNPSNSGAFTANPSTPVVFSQVFPAIDFNPPAGAVPCSNPTGVDEFTRPWTDVIPQSDGTCSLLMAQGNGQQAGVGQLFSMNAEFVGNIYVPAAGNVRFNFFSDDGWILSFGHNADQGQPAYVSGSLVHPPAMPPFNPTYQVAGSYNVPSAPARTDVIVNFPAAGIYPFELDYSECCAGQLVLVLTANEQGIIPAPTPLPPPSASPTPLPSVTPAPPNGSISGTVYHDTAKQGSELPGAFLAACPSDDGRCRITRTDPQGHYSLMNLARTRYVMTVFPPNGSHFAPGHAEVVLTTALPSAIQDFVLSGHTPPPDGTTITHLRTNPDGVPVLFWRGPITLTTHGCPGGSASSVILLDGNPIRGGAMTEHLAGTFTANLAEFFPLHGNAQVVITMTCPGGASVEISFDIYIDPSGSVVDSRGVPIAGATVTLLQQDPISGQVAPLANGDPAMSPSNRQNPDTTDASGHFGWDVVAGTYQLQASKAGCSATASSDSFSVPPAAMNITLTLNCPGGDVNGDGATTVVDALCILRSVAGLGASAACPSVPLTTPSVGDTNNNGHVDAVDALCILRNVAGLSPTAACPSLTPSSSAPASLVRDRNVVAPIEATRWGPPGPAASA
ncbi:MAG: carboxypeptidase regulatory-like domain-containing protein [Dehalococcoidia bacterium]